MMAEYTSFTYDLLDELGEEHDLGCKCCRYSKGVDLPIPRKLSIKETKRASKHFSMAIFKDWTQLNAIVKRFERVIGKRWMKKNLKQRREILLKAWPGMSATHRPDFVTLRTHRKQAARAHTCDSDAFLWPYINLEDLQQRNLLLLFLNARGRHIPDTFRLADVKAAHLGEGWDRSFMLADCADDYCCEEHFIEEHHLDDVHMLFESKHNPSKYGTVITRYALRLNLGQFKFLRRATEGLLSLEIQTNIYRFLLTCVKLILHDVEPSKFFLAPHRPQSAMLGLAGPNEYPSLSTHSLESSYRVPQQLDLERLKMLVSSRRSAAEDHIWSLKEDPSYFMETMREWNEHNGSKTKTHPCNCRPCWDHTAHRALSGSFESFVFWDKVHAFLNGMPSIDKQLKRANEAKVCLDHTDEMRWLLLTELVWKYMYLPLGLLTEGIPTSPRLRSKFSWAEGKDGEKGRWVLYSKSEAEKRIYSLNYHIRSDYQREMHGLHGLVQEFQYMLDTDAEAAQYIDPWLASQYADMAICSEIVDSVNSLAPWFDELTAEKLLWRHTSNLGLHTKAKELMSKISTGTTAAAKSANMSWKPEENGFFDYPIDRRRTRRTTDQMRLAERRLDCFWASVEKEVKNSAGISMKKVFSIRAKQTRKLYRTSEWEEEEVGEPSGPVKYLSELDRNLPQHVYPASPTTPRKEILQKSIKDKIKTRGSPAAPDPRLMNPNDGPVPVAVVEKIRIPKRAYKVFSTLLPCAKEAQQPRPELPWDDLLYAMNAIGLQPIKLYGSVWMFRPVPKGETHRGGRNVEDRSAVAGVETVGRMNLERSIHFHEPKEVRKGSKISRGLVRTFGRRLKHAFGWEKAEDLFECE